jgi:hypothetical protein
LKAKASGSLISRDAGGGFTNSNKLILRILGLKDFGLLSLENIARREVAKYENFTSIIVCNDVKMW